MTEENRSQARLLAPIALAVFAVAFFAVVLGSGSGGGGEEKRPRPATRTETSKANRPGPGLRASYTVKTGDTLGEIARKTGVTVERLEELNPDLDPQALVSGQKIKLRE